MQEGEKDVTNFPVFNSDFLKNRDDHGKKIYSISFHVKSLYFLEILSSMKHSVYKIYILYKVYMISCHSRSMLSG